MKGLANVGVHGHSATLGETMGAYNSFAAVATTNPFNVVLAAAPIGDKPARKEALADAA